MDPSPTVTRASTSQRLATARATLDATITGATEAALNARSATEEWTALDLLRHIWVWNELCMRCLDDWLGSRDWILTFASEDQFNLEMVSARAGTSLDQILGGIRQAYARYETILAEASDTELAETAPAPWGLPITRTGLIWAELEHDLLHLDQLRASLSPR